MFQVFRLSRLKTMTTVLLAALLLSGSAAGFITPQHASAANPWSSGWLHITVNRQIVASVMCNVQWVREGTGYRNTVTCFADDRASDGKGVWVSAEARASASSSWKALVSVADTQGAAGPGKHLSYSFSDPARNFHLRIAYGQTNNGRGINRFERIYTGVPGR